MEIIEEKSVIAPQQLEAPDCRDNNPDDDCPSDCFCWD